MTRTYTQFCPIACSLDLIGERWTLLLARELTFGPRRFTDLFHALPGIGKNLLSKRLKELEAAGVIEQRELPPPGAAQVYALTPYGEELKPILDGLFGWGIRLLAPEKLSDHYLGVVPLMKYFSEQLVPAAARGLDLTGEFRIEGEVFQARIAGDEIRVVQGAPAPADFTIEAAAKPVLRLVAGALRLDDALESGLVRLERGSLESAREFFAVAAFSGSRRSGNPG